MRPSTLRASILTVGCALALATNGVAQSMRQVERIPRILAEPLQLTGGTLQRLVLPYRADGSFEFQVELGGERRTAVVEPHSLRADGFRIVELRRDGTEVELPLPAPTTFRGVVLGDPNAVVAVNLFEGQLTGVILTGSETWGIQPATEGIAWLPRNAHAVYRQDEIESRSIGCPTVAIEPHEHGADAGRLGSLGSASARNAPEVAQIAAELEPRFRNLWGGIPGAVNQASAILNAVDAIYARDVNVTFQVTALITREAGYSTNSSAVLGNMRSIWNARALDIVRDVAHLFMGSTGSNTIGIAYTGSLCTNSHYSVSWHTGSLTSRTAVTAHELGHSFSALHCDNSAQCFIMCSFIGGCSGNITAFAPVSQNVISNYAASRVCLN